MARSDSNFVNFIDKDDWVFNLGVIEGFNNFAWNSSNVCPAMALEQAGIT